MFIFQSRTLNLVANKRLFMKTYKISAQYLKHFACKAKKTQGQRVNITIFFILAEICQNKKPVIINESITLHLVQLYEYHIFVINYNSSGPFYS